MGDSTTRKVDRSVCIELLEPRRLLAGVTVITHGFQFSSGSVNWLIAMESALASKMGGANVYRMTITNTSNPTVSAFSLISAGGTATGEAIVDVNWSAVANNVFFPSITTATIASLIKPYLTTARNLPGDPLTAHPFSELPIHIAGHSRGGSLVADLARKLAADGLWVDTLTLWDPVPVGGDPAVSVADNVVFADNIYQNNASPAGSATAGAHNLNLSGISGVGHSEIHAFYEGTINRAATNDGDGITINNNWYTTSNAPRATTGYDWSRIGAASPPADGISILAGGSAARTHISVTSSTPWANVGSVNLSGDSAGLIANSNGLNITYRYQDSSAAGGANVSFFLDNNTNPLDGFARTYGSTASLGTTGVTPNVSTNRSFPITWTSSGLTEGTYRIAAKITNPAGETRYAYLPRALYITPGGAEIMNKWFSNDLANLSWVSAGNFTPGGMPVANDHVFVPTGSVTIPTDPSNLSLVLGATAKVTAETTQHLLALTLANGANLNLKDHDLIVTTASFSTLQALVLQGFQATTGITSSTSNGTQILALFDNALAGFPDYPPGPPGSGNSIAAGSIVGKYTYVGDTNMDGQVTAQDYTAIDANLGTSVNPGIAWFYGDTNFDGATTPQDYTGIDASLGLGVGDPLAMPLAPAGLSLKKDEPSVLE